MDQDQEVAAKYLEEHRQIRKVIAGLEAWLETQEAPASWVSSATQRLSELGEVLAPHFRREREGALYTEAPLRVPQHAARLERLMGEHQVFLAELGAILGAARGALDPDDELVEALGARISTLLESLGRHEADENEVLMAAFWDDVGVGD